MFDDNAMWLLYEELDRELREDAPRRNRISLTPPSKRAVIRRTMALPHSAHRGRGMRFSGTDD